MAEFCSRDAMETNRPYKPARPVRAQRKFAQGAHIPPQQSSPQVHSTPSASQTTQPWVNTMVHMKCKDVLDLVSLKDPSVPNNRRLVVVLENMDSEVITKESPPSSPAQTCASSKQSRTPVKSSRRRLRSQNSRDSEGRRRSSESPRRRSSSAEENKPLVYFADDQFRLPVTVKITRLEDDYEVANAAYNYKPAAGSSATVSAGPNKQPTAGPSKHVTAGLSKNVTAGHSKQPTAGPTKQPTAGPTKHVKAAPRKQVTAAARKQVTADLKKQVGPNKRCRPSPPVRHRSSSVSTTVSSLPLAYLKAQRQGLRMSLRQMKRRNTPGVKQRACGVTCDEPAEPKRRQKSATLSPRKRTEAQKETVVSPDTSTATSNTENLPSCSQGPVVGPTQTPIDEDASTFKKPCGVAKRAQRGRLPIHQYCPACLCPKCRVMSGMITIEEVTPTNTNLPHQPEVTGHDIYDFRNEDDNISVPSRFRGRSMSVQDRLSSVDSMFGSRAPDTMTMINVIDRKINTITTYQSTPEGRQLAQMNNEIIRALQGYKEKLSELERQERPEAVDGGPGSGEMLLEAPVFRPTMEEMTDLNAYLQEKIGDRALPYGICKIVPPAEFRPNFRMRNVPVQANNQYVGTLFDRWGPCTREMKAIMTQLAMQEVTFEKKPPLFEGVEVDLVKLYHLVQRHGGLIQVMRQHKWAAIGDEMKLIAGRINPDVRFDNIYIKYILPYDTLSADEREALMKKMDLGWERRHARMLSRAAAPLARVERLRQGLELSDEDEEPVPQIVPVFAHIEDCIVAGKKTTYDRFKKVGERIREIYFPENASPDPRQVEEKYWRHVQTGREHVCVHGASLDSTPDNLGFTRNRNDPTYGEHPWNLKRLGEDANNVLSYLGPTLAVTAPTLHVGMMFTSHCWHRDPHQLPWTEYMHEGPPKIWYGIAMDQSEKFRSAMEKLCPTLVQNKSIWLPSDNAMVPPELLMSQGVRLSRLLQHPGEYVIVLPRAYSCSISTGVTVSESLYFASTDWLERALDIFQELRLACEPSTFSVEHLLTGIVRDARSKPLAVWRGVHKALAALVKHETVWRKQAADRGLPLVTLQEYKELNPRDRSKTSKLRNVECTLCRYTLSWSKVVNVPGMKALCIEDGLKLLQNRERTEETAVILFVSNGELKDMLKTAQRRMSEAMKRPAERRGDADVCGKQTKRREQ